MDTLRKIRDKSHFKPGLQDWHFRGSYIANHFVFVSSFKKKHKQARQQTKNKKKLKWMEPMYICSPAQIIQVVPFSPMPFCLLGLGSVMKRLTRNNKVLAGTSLLQKTCREKETQHLQFGLRSCRPCARQHNTFLPCSNQVTTNTSSIRLCCIWMPSISMYSTSKH